MSDRIWLEIKELFGERATTELFERRFYQRDVAPVPDFLVNSLARTLPDIVVRPVNAAEVATVVRLAAREGIAVTGRAGGSTVYFNSVCVKQGILVDLNGLTGVLSVDRTVNCVRVAAGTSWSELERELNRQGLAVCAHPSSAPSATVGGWLAMRGYGLGTLKYGNLADQVVAAQVVLPDGRLEELTADTPVPLDWLAGSEGTLGLITAVELLVRPLPEAEWHGLAACRNARELQDFIEQAVRLPEKPFNLHFSDPACNKLRYRLGSGDAAAAGFYTVAFDADGTAAQTESAARGFAACLAKAGAADLSAAAAEEWEQRFFSLLLKREGPSLLGAELWLPIDRLAAYLTDIDRYEQRHRLGLKTYGHVASAGHAMVMTMFNADERNTVAYLQGLALVKKLHDIGARHGAAPYGTGLWNTSYLPRSYSEAELAERRRRKQLLDPGDIMNPGKLYQAPLPLRAPLFGLGMDLLAASRAVYQGGNRHER